MNFKSLGLFLLTLHTGSVHSTDSNEIDSEYALGLGGSGVAVHPMSYAHRSDPSNATVEKPGDDKVTDALHGLLSKYDNRIRPFYAHSPVIVNVSLGKVEVVDVVEANQELNFIAVLQQSWVDTRLQFTENEDIDRFTINNDHIRELWLPDTCFTNEKKAPSYDTGGVADAVMLTKHGFLLRSSRLSVSTHCRFDYAEFPFDKQTCVLEIGSHAYTSSDVTYKWNVQSESMLSIKRTGNFVVTNVSLSESQVQEYYGQMSRLRVELTLQRAWKPYVTRFYVPLISLVFVSLGSLFLVDNRVALVVNLANLAFISIFASTQSTSSRSSAHTAHDSYFIICLAYISTVLIITLIRQLAKRNYEPTRTPNYPETLVLTQNRPRSSDIFDPMNGVEESGDGESRHSVTDDTRRIYRTTSYPLRMPSWWRVFGRKIDKFGMWFVKHLRWILICLFILTDYLYFSIHSVAYSL